MSLKESLDDLVCPTMPSNWLPEACVLWLMTAFLKSLVNALQTNLRLASPQDESYYRDPPLADFGNILFNIPAEWRTFREKPG